MKFKKNNFLCPTCKLGKIVFEPSKVICVNSNCNKEFDVISDKPILIDFNKSVLKEENFKNNIGKSEILRNEGSLYKFLRKILFGDGLITSKNMSFIDDQIKNNLDLKILIVGGGTIGAGMSDFYKKYDKNILSFDIYSNPRIDFVADAHDIPISDNTIDLIIIQAVLEHVLIPENVVSECYRVLKQGGLIYSETPFMQQVHEGAYDFTRYTDSGHRYLFKSFSLIKSGSVAGLGTSLLWSISYFIGGLFKSVFMRKISRLFFFWLRFFDFLISDKFNIDGSSGLFFLGKKGSEIVSKKEIIKYYKGAQ